MSPLLVVFIGLLALGCGPRRQLAGHQWSTEMMNFPTTLTFERNGAAQVKISSPLGDLVMKGTYSETEESVSLTIQDVDVPPLMKEGTGMLQRLKGAPIAFKLEWRSDQEVALAPQGTGGIFGQSIVLRRKLE